jgi:hypothetical protein
MPSFLRVWEEEKEFLGRKTQTHFSGCFLAGYGIRGKAERKGIVDYKNS